MINDQEIKELNDVQNIDLAISKTFELGLEYIIVKMGSKGALLLSKKGERFKCPAIQIERVIDPTGAGDSFAGGFMGYVSSIQNYSFDDLKKAVCWGTVMASYCVENFGTQNITQLNAESYKNRYSTLVKKVFV